MNVSVWDTYVLREDGKMMHFDILAPTEITDEEIILGFGKQYLATKPLLTKQWSVKKCRYCHIEQANAQMISSIEKVGFHIIEMENCT